MPRVIWKEAMSFSLSRIPVSLHSASREHSPGFSLLDRHDRAPIEQRRTKKNTGKSLEWGAIVAGCPVEANRATAAVSSCCGRGRGHGSSSTRHLRA